MPDYMIHLGDRLADLQHACAARDWCWSIGTSRVAEFECRAYPRALNPARSPSQTEVLQAPIIEAGRDFDEAIRKVIDRLMGQKS